MQWNTRNVFATVRVVTLICCLVGLALATKPSVANTLQREQTETSTELEYHYNWQDHEQQARSITLSFPRKELYQSFRKFRSYQPERANRELRQRLIRYARAQGWRNIDVQLTERERQLEIRLRNSRGGQQRLNTMRSQYDVFLKAYLAENFYNEITDHLGRTGIKPDHVKIAHESDAIIDTVAQSFRNMLGDNTQREYLQVILSFMQSMPYETLTDRLDSNGAGFNPPSKLLLEHQGDCDSKATFIGGVIRKIMPDVPVYIVYVPNHAFLALRLTRRDDEKTVSIDGQDLVVIDPTGPAQLRIGEMSSEAQRHIDAGHYQVERFQ